MIIEPEEKDWRDLKVRATEIIRESKLQLEIWLPIMEQIDNKLKLYPSK